MFSKAKEFVIKHYNEIEKAVMVFSIVLFGFGLGIIAENQYHAYTIEKKNVEQTTIVYEQLGEMFGYENVHITQD